MKLKFKWNSNKTTNEVKWRKVFKLIPVRLQDTQNLSFMRKIWQRTEIVNEKEEVTYWKRLRKKNQRP